MARIRSTHPGQWTDEDFVQLSFPARLLCLAIRNEADDQGVFEWKPTTLKMRLLPADALDIDPLLSELEAHNQVKRYEVEGRQYGVIRNFRAYQRPKSPNSIHPLPPEFRKYAGMNGNDFPATSETLPKSGEQMEEVIEGKEEGDTTPCSPPSSKTAPPSASPSKRGSRLPEDWKPTDDHRAYAKGHDWTDAQVDQQGEQFRDHWLAQPGQKGVKLDWDATWRTWVRNAEERFGLVPGAKPNGADDEKRKRWKALSGSSMAAKGATPGDDDPLEIPPWLQRTGTG